MTARVMAVGALTFVYAAMLESFAWPDVLAGVAVSIAVLAWMPGAGPRLGHGPGALRRVPAAITFLAHVGLTALRGTLSMAAFVLGLRPGARSGLVEIPIGARTETGILVTAWALTLSPGSALVSIERERGVLVFHFADARDPDAIRRKQATVYERYQRRAFP